MREGVGACHCCLRWGESRTWGDAPTGPATREGAGSWRTVATAMGTKLVQTNGVVKGSRRGRPRSPYGRPPGAAATGRRSPPTGQLRRLCIRFRPSWRISAGGDPAA
ncbi:hypothetical protein SFR_4805 [Streptomyces sp. FR-008]|nr:hypothetical protein SFR_4805 [Streptomyces sp. FR-008]